MIMGIESDKASFLLSIVGISSIFGKIGLCCVSDHPKINRMYVFFMCLIICGISEYKSGSLDIYIDWKSIASRPCNEQFLLQLFDPHPVLHCIWCDLWGICRVGICHSY